ncbi:MAG: reverse transcriptase domain-containing protein [archaeon]
MENLYEQLCSKENLKLAFQKARKGKTSKPYIKEFEENLKQNLLQLRTELLLNAYRPKPHTTFILRDPKTRKISRSNFRDRVVHHALCNIIEPIFDKTFIFDSYANRKGKGSLKAIKRLEVFNRKISKNFNNKTYILKADIKQYFDNVDHKILLSIIKKKIKDKRVLFLIKIILSNYYTNCLYQGMPLGNLTSQFFANIYLNELDQFVKHKLKAKYYIRYVDDFIILDSSYNNLTKYKKEIDKFLQNSLRIQLHPEKSKIINLNRGVNFLGFKVFNFHKRIQKRNIQKYETKFNFLLHKYNNNKIDYDKIYNSLEGWLAYLKQANTLKLQKQKRNLVNKLFSNNLSTKDINRILKDS